MFKKQKMIITLKRKATKQTKEVKVRSLDGNRQFNIVKWGKGKLYLFIRKIYIASAKLEKYYGN